MPLAAPDALGDAGLLVLQPVIDLARVRCRHDGGEGDGCGDDAVHSSLPYWDPDNGGCPRRKYGETETHCNRHEGK